eukprot:gene18797-25342_t
MSSSDLFHLDVSASTRLSHLVVLQSASVQDRDLAKMKVAYMKPSLSSSASLKAHRAVPNVRATGFVTRRGVAMNSQAGGKNKPQPFNESASQVKRLISRDRKEFMGNQQGILQKFETEFGDASPNSDDSARSIAGRTPNPTPLTLNSAPLQPYAP